MELMKNIKKILKYLFGLIIIGLISFYCFFELDMKMVCLDGGQIYDPIQKKCRNDCLTWDEKIGCVPITEENSYRKAKGLPLLPKMK